MPPNTPLLFQISQTLGRVEEKIDALTKVVARGEEKQEIHEKRILSLENWRLFVAGGAATISGIVVLGFKIMGII